MPSPAEILGQPFVLGCGATIKNRIFKSAMSETLARGDHAPNERHATLYRRWAEGGGGLIITGNVMIDGRHLGEPGNVVVEDERHLDTLRRWAAAGTVNQTQLWVQLNHPGRQAPGFLAQGGRPVAPSAVGFSGAMSRTFPTPRPLEEAEIEDIIARFGRSAGIVKKAGFTGVQIHGAHGYLVSQFLSPRTNRRTDRWGGSLENRMRFPLAVYQAIRDEVGSDFPVSIKMNSADFQKDGLSEDDSVVVMEALADAGIDMIEISGGTYEAAAMMGKVQKESTKRREAYFLRFAELARKRVTTALGVTGGFRTARGMAEAVSSGAVDLVGVARPFALYPDFPARILRGESPDLTLPQVKTGIRPIDQQGMLELTFYENQLHLLGSGKAPRPQMSAWESLVRTISSTGLQALRRRRGR
ncbi:MAG: NADH:flavin oxidoreductase/NADH oxidase family protein [Candidatus Dadabacteria bacterium]|nr:MAG: NADH:flavin oxidoreductase/NADH oxidase family protein [Candidatus Dadabacteria bacterium]